MLFSDWLKEHARGDLDVELGEALEEVGNGVLMVDKKAGTVTLTVNIAKSGRMLQMTGEFKTKIPKSEPESSMFYIGEDGLTKDDPYQMNLVDRGNQPLYEVGPDGALKNAGDATAAEEPAADAPGSPRNPHPADASPPDAAE